MNLSPFSSVISPADVEAPSRNGEEHQIQNTSQGLNVMPILLWLIGIPIPIILLLFLLSH
jgi:hypothetical protein